MRGLKASQRTRKAWVTRRRNDVWTRPTGEKIKLQGFTPQQRRQIRPVLARIDASHPNTDLNLRRVALARRNELERRYSYHHRGRARVGGLTRTSRISGRSIIEINPKAFKKRSPWNPQGVLAHEIGHAAHESASRNRQYKKQFKNSFATTKGKTRSNVSPAEHFAETFRVYHGYPMTKKEHKYFMHTVDNSHINHLRKHYI